MFLTIEDYDVVPEEITERDVVAAIERKTPTAEDCEHGSKAVRALILFFLGMALPPSSLRLLTLASGFSSRPWTPSP